MFKTASKFMFALAGFGVLAAFAYAGGTGGNKIGMDTLLGTFTLGYRGYVGEHAGFTILVAGAAVALFLGVFLAALRDADPEAAAQVVALDVAPEAAAPTTVNYWPVVGAFSVGALALGLAIGPAMFVIGLLGLVIVTVEWAVRTWSDRATGDAEVNRTIRNRLMGPIEVPAIAVLGIGGLVLAISRILLALPKIGGYLVFGLVPAVVLAVGAVLVAKPKISQSVVAGLLLVGGVALLAGGVAAAVVGEHHTGEEEHEETTPGEEGLAPMPLPSAMVIRVGN